MFLVLPSATWPDTLVCLLPLSYPLKKNSSPFPSPIPPPLFTFFSFLPSQQTKGP